MLLEILGRVRHRDASVMVDLPRPSVLPSIDCKILDTRVEEGL